MAALEPTPLGEFVGKGVEHSGQRAEQSGAEQEQGNIREPIQGVGHVMVKLGYCFASSLSDRFPALPERGLLITAVSSPGSFQRIMTRKLSNALSAVPRYVAQRPGDINFQRLTHFLRQFDEGLSAEALTIPENSDQIRVLDNHPIPSLLCPAALMIPIRRKDHGLQAARSGSDFRRLIHAGRGSADNSRIIRQ